METLITLDRKGCGMCFTKTEFRETFDLAPYFGDSRIRIPERFTIGKKLFAQKTHLILHAVFKTRSTPEQIRFSHREPRPLMHDTDDVFLVDHHFISGS